MSLALKPAHASVKAYYETLHQFGQLYIDHEGAVRRAFQDLLAKCGRRTKPQLTLVTEYPIERARSRVIVDGALVDLYHLPHGYWEAKDEKDDLAKEVQRKLDKGYPRDNIIFQAPERAILYQGGVRIFDENISHPEPLVSVVNQFFDYKAPHIQEWEQAVGDFSERIPELATAVKKTIDEEKKRNPAFVRSFDDFYALCRQAINPNLSEEAVERMLVQHLLTERIFRKIFNNPDFTRRNVVAVEIEKVITELTRRSLNRDEFLGGLERFYRAIERSAEETTNFSEKQAFLNKVYERFFQGYSPKEADTHGIVYTPQPIVNFMVRSVEEIVHKEFGRSLGNKGVHILDPFVGTGNFIVRIMQEIKTTDLPYKYENELHCNEVMLLPYYIASMNIEHAYFERTGEYSAFPGICLVDTFELAEPKQSELSFMTAANADRVKRQKESPIFVIIGNPPYNAGQVDENDNNRNRKYPVLEERIASTYGEQSDATLLRSLSDPFVKAFRWATERLGEEGVIAFVTNNSFIENIAFDGMRKQLLKDFRSIYIVDLGGNVRKNPKLSGTTHNVFGIQVGVSINVLLKKKGPGVAHKVVNYARTEEFSKKEDKYKFLDDAVDCSRIRWQELTADEKGSWITSGFRKEYEGFLPIASKAAKKSSSGVSVAFKVFSRGACSNADAYAYNFDHAQELRRAQTMVDDFNSRLDAWRRKGNPQNIEKSFSVDETIHKWIRYTKKTLLRDKEVSFAESQIRASLYRPYCRQSYFFHRAFNEDTYRFPEIFPTVESETENRVICAPGVGGRARYWTLCAAAIPNVALTSVDAAQCFPFYTYAEDGTHRRENITDWALEQFRSRYHDPAISKWDIFHYIYAVLHHPDYRERYAANLRRELPRIPFVAASSPCSVIPNGAGSFACENDPAESRDPVPADAQHRRREEFSARTSSGGVRGGNSSSRRVSPQANTGSFDSAKGFASESPRSAQDDNVGRVAQDDSAGKQSGISSAQDDSVGGMAQGDKMRTTAQDDNLVRASDLDVFRAFVRAGQRLAEIHVHYEQQPEYPLTKAEKAGEKLDYRVIKMKLSKDKTSLIYNQFLTLSGIPKETYEYRLGNRSALEWVIDQYQVSTDKRSGITNDPNREDDRKYILRLVGQVITVSLETVETVRSLPALGLSPEQG